MLKEKRQLFEVLFMAVDLFVVTVAWLLSYWIRFQTDFVPADKGIPPFVEYISVAPIIWLIWGSVFKQFGLYKPMRGVRRTRELFQLLNANSLSLLLFIAAVYLLREKTVPYSRLVFVYFGAFALLLTVLQRICVRGTLRELRRKGHNLRYMLLVGEGKVAEDIVNRIRGHQELGIQLMGALVSDASHLRGPGGVPVIGSYYDVAKSLKMAEVDHLVIALPLEHNHFLPEIMTQVGDHLVDVKIVPDLYQFVTLGGSIEEFEGLPVISVQSSPMEGVGRYIKRTIDIVVSFILIVLLSPLLFIIALALKITSKGPIFYRQQRVSFDGTRFTIYKFRTMRENAEEDGPGWTTEKDDRVTSLGGFLRSFSLDELPQFFNVLRGDMSIVGPRPERPVFIEEFRRRVPRYMLRHKVPAGITGWAQVNGWRGNTSIDKRIEYDLYYIENWSILLDIKILFLTIFKGFRNKNAY